MQSLLVIALLQQHLAFSICVCLVLCAKFHSGSACALDNILPAAQFDVFVFLNKLSITEAPRNMFCVVCRVQPERAK
jgi:hypothetical protein